MDDEIKTERARLIRLITGAIRQYEQSSYRGWSKNPRPFLNSLTDTDTPHLQALCDVLLTRYLEPPLVQLIVTNHDWKTILTLNAHLEWLHKHPCEVQHLLNRVKDLGTYLGIERHDNGWHPTLEVHLRAEDEYHRHSRYKDHEDVAYIDNMLIICIVEDHAEHADYLIPYMNSRNWDKSFNAQHFMGTLDQHDALKGGWL